MLPDAATAEPKASDALEEAWKAAEVGPETFEEKAPKEEEEEAEDAQKTSWRSGWAGWESDVEEEKAWEEEVKETTLPEPSSGTGKGDAKGKGGGRGAFRAGLKRLAGFHWQEMTRTRSGQPLSYLYTQTQALSIVL